MKRYIVAVLAAVIASGCTSTATKSFKVFTDPVDAEIRVVSGAELKESRYRSPAAVTFEVPGDPEARSKAFLEVSKDDYKPFTVALQHIRNGQTLNIRLKKIEQSTIRYRLAYRLVAPAVSKTLQFKDKTIAISFAVNEQSIQMHLTNLRDQEVKVLWEQAQFTDVDKQTSRLMHTGIRFQDRNNPVPDQIVAPRASVQEGIIPINRVFVSQQTKAYETKPLLPIDTEEGAQLKGKKINLFLPMEVDRAIIPYNFKIEITDSVREEVKG